MQTEIVVICILNFCVNFGRNKTIHMIFSQKQFGFFKQFALIMLFLIVNQAQAMVVFVNYAVFKSSGENSFVELYLKIPVNTITFQKNEHGGFQSSVFIDLKFSYKDSVFFYNR